MGHQKNICTNSFVTPSVTVGNTAAVITWTTPSVSSSMVEYGLTATTRSPTPEIDISPRVTQHSIELSGLATCTTYDYRVVSHDANSNTKTSVGNTFTTSGCAAASTIVDTSTEQITKSTGGTLTIENTDSGGATLNGMTLTIPSDFSVSDANFQAQQLDKTAVIETLPAPSGYTLPENMIYELRAVKDDSATISTFDYPLTMTMTYGDADIVGIKEETLRIYSSNGQEGSTWSPLPNCVVDTQARTVTCSTTHFSVFALFGEAVETVPTVTTPTSTSITSTGATLGANVTSLGIPASISARGICWGTTAHPVSNCTAEGGTTTGIFTQGITGLTPNTTYYYRGYAVNATGTAYSDDGAFTTTNVSVPFGGGSGGGTGSTGSSTFSLDIPILNSIPKLPTKNISLEDFLKNMIAKNHTGFATRLETILLSLKMRGVSLVGGYTCLKFHTDTSGKLVPSYTCQVAEKARTEKIISQTNKQFNPLRSISRIEAYSVMMKSICIHPVTNAFNWETKVIQKAMELGFTVKNLDTFEPDRPLTTQEMYIITQRFDKYTQQNKTCSITEQLK